MADFTPQQIEQFLQEFFDVVGARQYVGARYVPIFGRAGSDTIEWDDTAPYEPLTVVLHQGVSYVSRRYVPAGVDIGNTDYWVQTYRFNAQVEQYRQEVLGFQDQIDDKVPFPDDLTHPRYGTAGQVLNTLGDGSTMWADPVTPSDEQAEAVITQWLDDHPEATTTVEDDSVTDAKLVADGVKNHIVCTLTFADGYVDYDTTNSQITIPAGVLVAKMRNGLANYYNIPEAVTLAVPTSGATYHKCVFNASTNAFSLISSSTVITYPLFYVFTIARKRDGVTPILSADFPWSIDGRPYGLDLGIADDSITDAKLVGNGVKGRVICSITPPADTYVNYDTTNGVVEIPQSTIVAKNRNDVLVSYAMPGATTVSVPTSGATSIKCLFNLSTHEFRFVSASTTIAYPEAYLFAMGRIRAQGTTPRLSADFPWSIDGRPYGLDLTPDVPAFSSTLISAAHRGMSYDNPENTMPAFKAAIDNGTFTHIETDVRFTSDGIAVLCHDPSINRTARNDDGTDLSETVYVATSTYSQLMQYDFGIFKGSEFAGQRIVTLDAFLNLCRCSGILPMLDIKITDSAQLNSVASSVFAYGLADKVFILCGEHFAAAQTMAQLLPRCSIEYGANSSSDFTQQVFDNLNSLETDVNKVWFGTQSFNANNIASIRSFSECNLLISETYTNPFDKAQILALNPYIKAAITARYAYGAVMRESVV